MSTAKKSTPPPLSLPERPPSKVEAGLKGDQNVTLNAGDDEPSATVTGGRDDSPEALRERAVEAMVAAGLSREFAEASFVLAEENLTAADVAEAVTEVSTEPLCSHGCHGQGWADVPAALDGVSCEHGSFSRRPQE